jgi:uncharacterized protein (DUF2147 family)
MNAVWGAALAIALAATTLSQAFAADATGIWTTAEGKAHVRVAACGSALCGTVIWLREPNGPDGRPKLDDKNEDAAQRNRPILGSSVLLGMKPSGDDQWKGSIYNAEDGKTYSATFTLQGTTSAQLQGCVAAIFCKSQVWTRN